MEIPDDTHTRAANLANLVVPFLLFHLAIHAAFAQTTLNLSEDLVSLGIASSNMTPNQPTLDAGPLLVAGLNYAQANQIGTVIADPGAYYFLSFQRGMIHVSLAAPSNLTVDFQGSDLYFANPLTYGLVINNGANLVLQNFTLDFQPLPFTQVQVTSVNADQSQIQFTDLPGWQDPSALNAVFTGTQQPTGGGGTVEVHVFRSGAPAPNLFRMSAILPISGSQFTIAPDFYATSSVLAQIRPGDVVVLAMRGSAGPMVLDGCTGCTFRNITAYSSAGNGVQVDYTSSTLLERVNSIPRPNTDRLISTFGQEFGVNGPNDVAHLNRAIRTMDDAFTYQTFSTGVVLSQPTSTSLVVDGVPGASLGNNVTLPNGTPVTFQDSDGNIDGQATIVSQNKPPFVQPYPVTFTFDRDLPSTVVGTTMYSADPTLLGAGTLLEKNAALDVLADGFAIFGMNGSTLQGNYTFRSNLSSALLLGGGTPIENFAVQSNVFDVADAAVNIHMGGLAGVAVWYAGANALPVTTSPNQNVSVLDNFIGDPSTSAVWMANTAGGSVSDNYFLNPNNNPQAQARFDVFPADLLLPLATETSSNITIASNTIDQSSGRMFITDPQFNELAAYAPGGLYALYAYDLGTLPKPAITLTDANGATWPVTIGSTATHSLGIQIPASAALGGAYFTLTSGSAKYFGTLFLDSQDNVPALNGCTYETSFSSTSVAAGASTLPILVVTQAGCTYQVYDTDSFVSPGGTSTGTAVISVGFAANTGALRTTTVEIAGQQVTVTQAQPVTLSVSTQLLSFNAVAGQSTPAQSVTISNTGPAGSTLNWTATVSSSPATNWLSVNPATGTNSGTIQVAVNAASLTAGSYSGTITITAPGARGSPATVSVTVTLSQPPVIQAIYDPWNYTLGVAPGAWVTIAGTALATGPPQTWSITGPLLPTALGGAMVLFNGTPAALLYVSSTQINALVPSTLAPGPAQVVVQSGRLTSNPFPIAVAATLPAVYAPASADGSAFYVTAPLEGTALLVGNSAVDSRVLRAAEPGDILDLYMIGLGATANPADFITNQNFSGAYPVSAAVTVTVGNEPATVLFAGLTSPGLYLVRIAVPSDLPAGQSPIQVSAGGVQTRSSLFLTLQAAPQGNLLQDGNFESPLAASWYFYVDSTSGAAATASQDPATVFEGSDSTRVDVTSAAAMITASSPCLPCAIQFEASGIVLVQGHVYSLNFWAMADSTRTLPIALGGQGVNYGLNLSVGVGTGWQQYVIYFQSNGNSPSATLSFLFGGQAGNTWLNSVVIQDTSQ